MPAHSTYSIRITGRVQGVGYRYYALRIAGILGIGGWIRNAADGSVLAEAEGERMEEFLDHLRQGPPLASVEEVMTEEIPAMGFRSFQVR